MDGPLTPHLPHSKTVLAAGLPLIQECLSEFCQEGSVRQRQDVAEHGCYIPSLTGAGRGSGGRCGGRRRGSASAGRPCPGGIGLH